MDWGSAQTKGVEKVDCCPTAVLMVGDLEMMKAPSSEILRVDAMAGSWVQMKAVTKPEDSEMMTAQNLALTTLVQMVFHLVMPKAVNSVLKKVLTKVVD